MIDLSINDRLSKRPRLIYESSDPELTRKRARHDLHLKSRFEQIFEKYERDFSKTADEVDLETGEIVVNNGHLAAMTDEFDPGQDLNPDRRQQSDVWAAADELGSQDTDWIISEREDHIAGLLELGSTPKATTGSYNAGSDQAIDHRHILEANLSGRTTSERSGQPAEPLESRMHNNAGESSPTNEYHLNSSIANDLTDGSEGSLRLGRQARERAWQAPPLPEDNLRSSDHPGMSSVVDYGSEGERSSSPPVGSLWAPMAGRGRPRHDGPATQHRRPPTRSKPLIQLDGSTLHADLIKHRDDFSCISSQARRKHWTQKETQLLMKIKTTTDLSYTEMECYFPGRNSRSIAYHWSKALLCGNRLLHSSGSPEMDPMQTNKIEHNPQRPHGSPSLYRNAGEPPSTGARLPDRSKAASKRPFKASLMRISSLEQSIQTPRQRLEAASDLDDELGDYPLGNTFSTIRSTRSSPVFATSSIQSVFATPKAIKLPQTTTSEKSEPPVKEQLLLNRTPPSTILPTDDDELSDLDELGQSPPRGRAPAPSSRMRPGLSVATPVAFRAQEHQNLVSKATTTPRATMVEDLSEDELATPIKTIRPPQASVKKLCGSSRRKSS